MNKNDMTGADDLFSEFRALVKRANSRLDRLEKAGKTDTKVYKTAMQYINRGNKVEHDVIGQWLKASKGKMKNTPFGAMPEAQPRKKHFSAENPHNIRVLRARYNAVQRFLEDETSTLSGGKAVGNKVSQTLYDKYGLMLPPEMLPVLFEGSLWKKLDERYGSDVAMKIVTSLQENEGDVKQALKDVMESGTYLSGRQRMSIGATIGNLMRKSKLDYLFEGF